MMEPVNKDLTIDTDWKVGEVSPKERDVALRHVRKQRELGMPKELDGYDIGVTITINGRHVQHLGATIGIEKGKCMTRQQVMSVVGRCLLPYISPETRGSMPEFSESDRFVLFGRDNV